MRTAPTRLVDTRRTLTPEGAQIALIAGGFEVALGEESIALISWELVRAIYAYTRFINERSNLCLAFVMPDTDRGKQDQLVIHDAVPGWEAVASQLVDEFPSMDRTWRKKAAYDPGRHVSLAGIVPAYTMNVTQVWPPIEELRPNTSLERTRER
jgi:hypothetical protein